MQAATPAPFSSAGAHYFLPLLYMAWSDEVLTPSELIVLREIIEKQDWLSAKAKEELRPWLDPQHSPSPSQLKEWLGLIRSSANQLAPETAFNLLQISTQLADLGTEDQPDRLKNDAAEKALLEIEQIWGIRSEEAVQDMLTEGQIQPRPRESGEAAEIEFTSQQLQAVLDAPNADLREKIRQLLSDPIFSYDHIKPDKESYREQVLEWLQYLADQGYGALAYPEYAGGKDDMSGYITVFEMLGHHDLSLAIKFGVQFGLFGGSIEGLGTEAHHKAYLPDASSMKLPGCFAMTEAGHGSNVRDIDTTATYDPETESFIIHTPNELAYKEYIGNAAAHGKMATVFAQLHTQGEHFGVHAFLVPIRDASGQPMPGIRIGDSGRKLGLNGVDNGRIWFDHVRVPRENLLNRFADVAADGQYSSPISSASRRFFTMLGTLVGGRVCVPMAGLSASKTALNIAISYGGKRRQFGPSGGPETTILDYRSHQKRLFPRLAKAYALHFAHRYMVDRFLQMDESESREIEALAAGLKAQSTWFTTDTIQACREACGGSGYLWVNRFADLKADTDIFTTFEGDNTVLLQLVAKGRLSDFKQEFASMKFWGLLNYLGSRIATEFVEKNPITKRMADEAHLLDPTFHLNAFSYREEALVRSAASRLKGRLDQGMNSYEAFIEVQNHLIIMATAYIDRLILQQFQEAISNIEDPSLKQILKLLCDIYALSELQTHKGWYLESGYFESSKTKAIRSLLEKKCLELRPYAIKLVEAFGIPDRLLAAPIALEYPT